MSNPNELWFQKVITELRAGESLYLERSNKLDQTKLKREMLDIREEFAKVNPVEASMIVIYAKVKDKRFWVVLEKKADSPLVGFINRPNVGELEKVELIDTGRMRRLHLMVQDGLPREEIESLEGPISEDERKELFGDDT